MSFELALERMQAVCFTRLSITVYPSGLGFRPYGPKLRLPPCEGKNSPPENKVGSTPLTQITPLITLTQY